MATFRSPALSTGRIVNVNANASANFDVSHTLPDLNVGAGTVAPLFCHPPTG